MHLDQPTLMIAGSFVAAAAGAFLFLAWWHNPKAAPMLWWGFANFAFAAGLPLTIQGTDTLSPAFVLGVTLLNLSPGLIWASGRSSNNRPIDPFFFVAGAVIWLAAYAFPQVRANAGALTTLNQAMIAFYLLAAAAEFFDKRAEQVTSRQPLIVLLTLHGFSFAYGAWQSAQVSFGNDAAAFGMWLSLVHFETLVFVIGTSIFAVAMMREQNEMRQRIKANTDDLTGLSNRRAFYRSGENLVNGGGRLSLILCDLDGFKSINDRFGHNQGDGILKYFGDMIRRTLRETDIAGRVGGEEFAIILPDARVGEAREVAERIRNAFAGGSAEIGTSDQRATLSAGVVEADGCSSLDALMGMADLALYRAKANGRDRVEVYNLAADGHKAIGRARSAA